jgi:hypothetical protein
MSNNESAYGGISMNTGATSNISIHTHTYIYTYRGHHVGWGCTKQLVMYVYMCV